MPATSATAPTTLQSCQALKGWTAQAHCGWHLSQTVNFSNMGHVVSNGAGLSPSTGVAVAAIVLILLFVAARRVVSGPGRR